MYTLRERINNQSNINIVEWDRQFLQIFKGSESFAKLREKVRTGSKRLAFEAQATNINDFVKYLPLFCALRRKQKRIQKEKFLF